MAKRLNNSQRSNDKSLYNRDEEEIFNYYYEGTSDIHAISGINSSLKSNHLDDSSKENVELSLEVEIADSLKHLISSPEHQNSDLLDVTIVRPTDLEFVRGLDTTNMLTFKGSEVRNLIASMEREKQHKKKLIEECKRKVVASKITTKGEIYETNSKHVFNKRQDEKETYKRRQKRPESIPFKRNITVMSAPPKCSLQLDHKLHTNNPNTEKNVKYKAGEAYRNSAPMAILKPLVGEIKESLKHLEASINTQIGDGSSNNAEMKHYEQRYITSPGSSHSTERDQKNYYNDISHPTHQVYAAANNHRNIRTLLACQNTDRINEDNEKPCMCQHCGMVGLLIESQKRPIMQPVLIKKPDDSSCKTQKLEHDSRKDFIRSPHPDKIKNNDDNIWIFRDLASRLEALEIRVAAQEQRAVPKDYFKRIINKLWHKHNSDSQQTLPINLERTEHLKDHSTQYSTEDVDNTLTPNKETKNVRHRNVQIQQNTKRNYCVNPVVLVDQTDFQNQTQLNSTQESNKRIGIKTMNAISDFFSKKPETTEKYEYSPSKDKSTPMESFWRWGEEIIKPGFDLKIKIMSLLDERFKNVINTNELDNKDGFNKKPDLKITPMKHNTSKINSTKINTVKTLISNHNINKTHSTPQNLSDVPLPYEEKATTKNTESTVPNTSSGAFQRMLDMMSEKIYKDHVKPTVDAIKQDQKSFNSENTKQIYNMKAAMDAALFKMNRNDTHLSPPVTTNKTMHGEKEWRKDFLEPLELPTLIKNSDDTLNADLKSSMPSKSFAIPRVDNPLTTNLGCERHSKYSQNRQLLMPSFKLPVENGCDMKIREHEHIPAKIFDKEHKREKRESQHKSSRKHHTTDVRLNKKDKHVQIKYINPRMVNWNEESGVSMETEISSENNQVMLTDKSHKYEKLGDSNTKEKRRISHKHSATDKLAFLTKLTNADMKKVDIWSNILKQVKNYCRSKQDTVIIQIPTKKHKHDDAGITEVEFTIEDIETLAASSKVNAYSETVPQEAIDSNDMESFLLIRSRKILEEVHKRLEYSFQ